MTLTDFLLARIAEDEAVAKAATPGPWTSQGARLVMPEPPWTAQPWERNSVADCRNATIAQCRANSTHIARHDPARVLAECDSKRQIVEDLVAASERAAAEWQDYSDWIEGCAPIERPTFSGSDPKVIPGLEHAARTLALPYADHPDYREEWKP